MTDRNELLNLPTYIPYFPETDHTFDVPIHITIHDPERNVTGGYYVCVKSTVDLSFVGRFGYITIQQWIEGADIQPAKHWVFARIDYNDFPLVWNIDWVFHARPSYAEFGAYVDKYRRDDE